MRERALFRFYKDKKVLIPGGAGFIGSNLTKRLVEEGAQVTVVDAFSKYCGSNTFNLKGVRKKVTLVREGIEEFISRRNLDRYDIIFNCVGLADHHLGLLDPELDYKINCFSGLKILAALAKKRLRPKMIFMGSRGQYGRIDSGLIKEEQPLRPLDIQAIHKTTLQYYCSLYCLTHHLDISFLRLTNVYGPGQRLKGRGIGMVGEIIRNAIIGREIVIFGGLSRKKDILFVDDLIDALLLLGQGSKAGFHLFNLGGQSSRISTLLVSLRKRVKNLRVKIVPFSKDLKKIDSGGAALDIKKIKHATGWVPITPAREGIERTLDYYMRFKEYYL